MNLKRIVPERHSGERGITRRDEWESPLLSFRREMNRMFDNFFEGFPSLAGKERISGAFVPRVNVSETEKDITVSAELPGMDEKDVDVSIDCGVLAISGEKKEEREDQGGDYYYVERSSGSFRREIPLPEQIDGANIKASFKTGVLKVVIPLLPEARRERKSIPIKSE